MTKSWKSSLTKTRNKIPISSRAYREAMHVYAIYPVWSNWMNAMEASDCTWNKLTMSSVIAITWSTTENIKLKKRATLSLSALLRNLLNSEYFLGIFNYRILIMIKFRFLIHIDNQKPKLYQDMDYNKIKKKREHKTN
ncbi:hypothetical protein BpHYR1_001980 [Brachionus plicatilis]|uniref:Uncharacterized protein n=1 Tax=Brachionus plicatilis TaxID=10195 RepID=A0A3M7R7R8_BRAPC|nr:hypothetical protein BpHYR1_001980 [Brachionus plicatilis]